MQHANFRVHIRHVRLACSQCSLNIYHSCVQHSVCCVHHKSQMCIYFMPPARTSADKTSAHSWSYFAGTTFQIFLATLPQDFVAPQPRRPSSRVSVHHVEVSNLLHLRVILNTCMHKWNTAMKTIGRPTCRRSTNSKLPRNDPFLWCTSLHTLQSLSSLSAPPLSKRPQC